MFRTMMKSEERRRGRKFKSVSVFVVFFLGHGQYNNCKLQNKFCNSDGDLVEWQEQAKAEFEQLCFSSSKHANAVIVGTQMGV